MHASIILAQSLHTLLQTLHSSLPLSTAPTCRVGRMAGGPLFPRSIQRLVLLVIRRHAWCLFVLFMSFALSQDVFWWTGRATIYVISRSSYI